MASDLTVIVLAAGGGTRMKSKTAKVLHEIGGRSMVGHVLAAVAALEPTRVVAVVGHQCDQVGPHIQALLPDVVLAVQDERRRTLLDSLRRYGGSVRQTSISEPREDPAFEVPAPR